MRSGEDAPMLRMLALLLPALIPSWRFFARVRASPRVEFTVLGSVDEAPQSWQEFRPRPAYLPRHAMLWRLVWNPRWNESLFLVSCTERYLETGSERRLGEILSRIRSDLHRSGTRPGAAHLQLRFIVLSRDGDRVVREEVSRSAVHGLTADSTA
jgi:hypothetical protein